MYRGEKKVNWEVHNIASTFTLMMCTKSASLCNTQVTVLKVNSPSPSFGMRIVCMIIAQLSVGNLAVLLGQLDNTRAKHSPSHQNR